MSQVSRIYLSEVEDIVGFFFYIYFCEMFFTGAALGADGGKKPGAYVFFLFFSFS